MKNFDPPVIPESAKNYSLKQNVDVALYEATEGEKTTQLMLLMHYFLQGMPEPSGEARKLASTASFGETESPMFDKVFHVPLPIDERKQFSHSETRGALDLLADVGAADCLPSPYKTDIVVFDSPDMGTLKITKWHQDDPRGETPHNHPWCDKDGLSFISYIARGGYDETITEPSGETKTRTFRKGDLNFAHWEDFHTVHNILPGTLTILMCAPRAIVEKKGYEWGYLIFGEDGPEYAPMNDPRVKDETFLQRAAVQNDSLRFIYKKGEK